MSPVPNTGEPREAPKPQPIGSLPFIILFTTCTLCALFILWRRASTIRTVVGHQLKAWTGREGNIRLSLDDGPAAREFLEDDYDDDNEDLPDDEPLALRAQRLKGVNKPIVSTHATPGDVVWEDDSDGEGPPLPPPKDHPSP